MPLSHGRYATSTILCEELSLKLPSLEAHCSRARINPNRNPGKKKPERAIRSEALSRSKRSLAKDEDVSPFEADGFGQTRLVHKDISGYLGYIRYLVPNQGFDFKRLSQESLCSMSCQYVSACGRGMHLYIFTS